MKQFSKGNEADSAGCRAAHSQQPAEGLYYGAIPEARSCEPFLTSYIHIISLSNYTKAQPSVAVWTCAAGLGFRVLQPHQYEADGFATYEPMTAS